MDQRIVRCVAEVLREDDTKLIWHCSSIALTKDSRQGNVVVRAHLVMGRGMPPGMAPEIEERPLVACPQEAELVACPQEAEVVANTHGK